MKLTQEEAKRLFDYNKETGIFTWKVRRKGSNGIGNKAGTLAHNGYVDVCVDYKKYGLHRVAFLIETGEVPRCVDHINGNKSDNRWCNLRSATYNQNGYNYKGWGSATGYKNVFFDKRGNKKFFVAVVVDGKRLSGGYYFTAEDANVAAIYLRNQHHGEFVNHGV